MQQYMNARMLVNSPTVAKSCHIASAGAFVVVTLFCVFSVLYANG